MIDFNKPVDDEVTIAALSSRSEPSNEKSGRRLYDDYLDDLLSSSLDDEHLSRTLIGVARVVLSGPKEWCKSLGQILVEFAPRRNVVAPLARKWLLRDIEINDAERRYPLLQALADLNAPVTYIELTREKAVRAKFPVVWFGLAVIVTTLENGVHLYGKLVDSKEIRADALIARAPSIRIKHGDRAARFFELAADTIKRETDREKICARLNKMYGFGLQEKTQELDGAVSVKRDNRTSPRIEKAEIQRILADVIALRNSGAEAA